MNQDLTDTIHDIITQFAALPEGTSASATLEMGGGLVIALAIGDAGKKLKETDL